MVLFFITLSLSLKCLSNMGRQIFFFLQTSIFYQHFINSLFHYIPFHNHHFYISVIHLILAAQGFSLASFLFHTPEDAKPCTKEGEIAEENKEKTPLWMVPGEQLVLIEGMNQVLLPSGKIICLCSWLWYHII